MLPLMMLPLLLLLILSLRFLMSLLLLILALLLPLLMLLYVATAAAAVDVATAAATVDVTSSVSAVGALTLYFLPVSGAFKRGSPYLFDCGSSRFRVPSKEVHPKILTAVALRPPSSPWLHEHD